MSGTRARPIALVGLMGAGKSDVAAALGARLGAAVADLDAMAEAESGLAVAELFRRDGEASFRRLEARLLEQALASGAGVIACGGGLVTEPGPRRTLRERCRVAWLEVEPATAAGRLAGSRSVRPLLEGTVPAARLAELLEARRPAYEEVAQVRVTTEGRTPDEVAEELLRLLREAP